MSCTEKKILHVISGLRSGGAENMLALMLENAHDSSIQHVVVSLAPGGITRKRIEKLGVEILDVGISSIFKIIPGIYRLVRIIYKSKPDIVQGWMYHGDLFSTLALLLSGRRKKTKLYWGVRCSDLKLASYSIQLRTVIRLCILLSGEPDRIISNSYAGAEYHRKIGYRDNFLIIENGVDVNKFIPNEKARNQIRKELKIDKNAIVLIMAARVDPMKNHDLFISTFRDLTNVIAIIAGEGTEKLEQMKDLHLLGIRTDMNKLFAASDVIVSCSSFGEGFSNSIVEGMACGLPVIATDVGDNKRIVGEGGYIVPFNNSIMFEESIKNLLFINQVERKKIGELAREYVCENFTIKLTIDKFFRVYKG